MGCFNQVLSPDNTVWEKYIPLTNSFPKIYAVSLHIQLRRFLSLFATSYSSVFFSAENENKITIWIFL